MAFPAAILGTFVSIAAFVVMAVPVAASPLASLGVSVLAGQLAFALVIVKAMICQSLRRTSHSTPVHRVSRAHAAVDAPSFSTAD